MRQGQGATVTDPASTRPVGSQVPSGRAAPKWVGQLLALALLGAATWLLGWYAPRGVGFVVGWLARQVVRGWWAGWAG